jgi:hypothetical protein
MLTVLLADCQSARNQILKSFNWERGCAVGLSITSDYQASREKRIWELAVTRTSDARSRFAQAAVAGSSGLSVRKPTGADGRGARCVGVHENCWKGPRLASVVVWNEPVHRGEFAATP